ncbi:MAG: tetratricopeptide repeat protein [Acidobacteriia bacterium]|nr:tetratricopeptide repeat protein [Terriglobia bacterium]
MEPESSVPAASSSERFYLWTVLFITGISYLGVVRFGFVYDDDPQILLNPFIKTWGYVPQYFWTSVWKHYDPNAQTNYYRPIFLLWARLNYAVFGVRPLGWHVTAILLHLAVTWLVYVTICRMTGKARLAWLTALVFGTHPIHHEVVAWVSGTTESLFAASFLLAFLAYLRSREGASKTWMFASYGCYALALLSKETAIVLPALVFAHGWLTGNAEHAGESSGTIRRLKQEIGKVAFYFPIALAYLLLRYKALSGLTHGQQGVTVKMWLLTLPSLLFFYLKNWFLPVRLSEMYDLFYQSRLNFAHVVLPALVLLVVAYVIWRFRKELGAREVGIAAAFIVIPLLPALDTFVFKLDELVHDRYFYVPSMGAALLVALLIERSGKGRAVAFGVPLRAGLIILSLTIALCFCTVRETRFWVDSLTLFTRAHEIAPQNSTAINNLGVEYLNNDQIDRAQAMLETGYQRDHGDFRYAFNLGRVHYVKRQLDQAEEYARQAIALNPNLADSYISLGQIQLKGNRPAEALKTVRRAVELNPYNAQFHTVYGIVLEVNGDCPAAIPQFEDALALNPGEGLTQREIFRCRSIAASPGSASTPDKP